jgi:alkane 1-monooxygenase
MGYGLYFLFGIGSAWGVTQGNLYSFTGALIVFCIHPILDYVLGQPKLNGTFKRVLFQPLIANLFLYLSTPFCILFLLHSFYQFSKQTEMLSVIGNALSTGTLMGVIAINTAHELVHRRQRWQRFLGLVNLTLVNFTWWKIAHVDLHHRHVSTPLDHASSKKNEIIYTFWIRNFFGSLLESYKFKPKEAIIYTLFNFIFNFLILSVFGIRVLIFSLAVSVLAIIMLLSVDYIEHYGLSRTLRDDGRYEPVQHKHSWDCSYLLTNFTLFNLGYHAHHHSRASVPFHNLELQESAPKMKYGYSLMMLRALILKN